MSDRPISFTADMVNAIRQGKKTETRRVIKPQPMNPPFGIAQSIWGNGVPLSKPDRFCIHAPTDVDGVRVDQWIACRYGKEGDHLYVKETFARENAPGLGSVGPIAYRADCDRQMNACPFPRAEYGVWRSSLFMPKAAARIWLRVQCVRAERVQCIDYDGAIAEGCEDEPGRPIYGGQIYGEPSEYEPGKSAEERYAHLWDSINGNTFPWCSNPWVWVVSFTVI